MKRFLVIFEKTGTGYSAYLPDLPGCVATGKTKEECEKNIYEAVTFHIEGMIEEGLPVPDSFTESEVFMVPEGSHN
jgi:predicted RNase H-like HicB family nuclease